MEEHLAFDSVRRAPSTMCTWRACAYGLAGQTSPCVLQYKGGLYLGCTLLTSQIGRYNPSYNPLSLQPPLLQPLEGCYNQLCCNNLRYKGCKLPVRWIPQPPSTLDEKHCCEAGTRGREQRLCVSRREGGKESRARFGWWRSGTSHKYL